MSPMGSSGNGYGVVGWGDAGRARLLVAFLVRCSVPGGCLWCFCISARGNCCVLWALPAFKKAAPSWAVYTARALWL